MNVLDLFSGIGGFSLGLERAGMRTIAFCEADPVCRQVLRKHWPVVPIFEDVKTLSAKDIHESVDIICGGFPCQDISIAGKQAGIYQGTRSGLFYELMRVICLVRPQYVVLENVSAIVTNGLDTVLAELAEAGFDAEWACIPASAVGACHQRDRWWLVAYAKSAGAWQHESHSRRQRDGKNLFANGCANKEISEYPSNTSSKRLERPQHSEWRAAEQLCPDWRSYVSQPVLPRGDDGLSNRVERLKALGNAVVPQVAAIPLARVRQLAGV